MATFAIEFAGQKFDVDAPNEAAALDAFRRQHQPMVKPKAEAGPWTKYQQPKAAAPGADPWAAFPLVDPTAPASSKPNLWDAYSPVNHPAVANPTRGTQYRADDIRVIGPDGSMIHFPKDTPEDVMTRALSQRYPSDKWKAPYSGPKWWENAPLAADQSAEKKWWHDAPLAPGRSSSKPTRLEIDGRVIEVGDNFLKLSPTEQQATVDEIAAEMQKTGKPPLTIEQRRALALASARSRKAGEMPAQDDPWREFLVSPDASASNYSPNAAASSMDGFLPPTVQGATPQPEGRGLAAEARRAFVDPARMMADGALMGTRDKISAGVSTGFGQLGDYDRTLADNRARTAQIEREMGPVASGALRGAGAMAGMIGAQAAGVPVLGIGSSLFSRAGTAAATMGGLGAGAGAINADGGFVDKATGAAIEGGKQSVIGFAGPVIGAGVGAAARPVLSFLQPAAEATRRVMNAARDAKLSPQDLSRAMQAAHDEGQSTFALVDAIGYPGQRLLTTATKTPGPGREFAREALEQRQAGQARRLTTFMEDAFQAPETAAQATARLTARRAEEAASNYALARKDAGAVDVSGAVSKIDRTLLAHTVVSKKSGLADDTVETAMRRARSLLAVDGVEKAAPGQAGGWGAYNRSSERLIDFQAVHRAMLDIGDWADAASRAGRNNQARLLGEVRKELDDALVKASPSYSSARDAYAAGSRQIEAVETGVNAAMRGRSEDVVRTFNALSPDEQAAFRFGYADKYITGAQGAAAGTNAARALTSDAVKTEFPIIAGGERGDRLMRQIERENVMHQTRQNALGGSSTFENASDSAAVTGVLESLMRGNPVQAATQAVGKTFNALQGNVSPAVERIARLLMERDPNFVSRLGQGQEASEAVKLIARTMMQLGLTGVADRALPAPGR